MLCVAGFRDMKAQVQVTNCSWPLWSGSRSQPGLVQEQVRTLSTADKHCNTPDQKALPRETHTMLHKSLTDIIIASQTGQNNHHLTLRPLYFFLKKLVREKVLVSCLCLVHGIQHISVTTGIVLVKGNRPLRSALPDSIVIFCFGYRLKYTEVVLFHIVTVLNNYL